MIEATDEISTIRMESPAVANDLYTSDRYLELTSGTWHLEDASFKAKYIDRMVQRHQLRPKTVCEVGCGAGGILAELQSRWTPDVELVGFEISPHAHQLSQKFARANLRFELGDAFNSDELFDVLLVMDVVEHVEDCFAFLRRARAKAWYKLYHIPLEITCTTALRDILGRGFEVGHIHHFSISSALAALRYTGHEIVDFMWTPVGLERGQLMRTRLMNGVRRILPQGLAARLVGGYSLLALTK